MSRPRPCRAVVATRVPALAVCQPRWRSPARYDGDGRLDIAVFRTSVGGWYRPGQPTVYVGAHGDVPLPGKWDTDAAIDLAFYRGGAWHVEGNATTFFGTAGDVP